MDDKMFMFIYALCAQYPDFSNFSPRGVVCSLSVIAVMVLIIAFKNLMPIKVIIVSKCSLFIYIFMCYSLIAN